ncbi:hypothetical protein CEY12_20690 [Chryseobacterium sp. T16E-39]|uniref:NUMOD4 domain-containing protein n=1 Tax=Chryseobacterium sp. T16E-39 TaxID=2015076 RepID=UPI000B5B317C|nr:NUMOD4 domain-containing protein [Chryseobacterium sp. T16E-39]ASK32352.1 hypothetical protein CEY12_20690 [Chryseobacterium sp. T16E-39]
MHEKAVNQYSVEGELIATFDTIDVASRALGVVSRNILHALDKKRLTAEGSRWFFKDYHPKKEDFTPIKRKSESKDKLLNESLWQKLSKPSIDKNNPPPCINLSLEDLPGEKWKPVKNFEKGYLISNKGRIKRLGSWTKSKNKSFWQETIMSINLNNKDGGHNPYFYIVINRNGQKNMLSITRLLYYSWVEEFDMNDKTPIVINNNEPLWNLDISKLRLRPRISLLKEKINNEKD